MRCQSSGRKTLGEQPHQSTTWRCWHWQPCLRFQFTRRRLLSTTEEQKALFCRAVWKNDCNDAATLRKPCSKARSRHRSAPTHLCGQQRVPEEAPEPREERVLAFGERHVAAEVPVQGHPVAAPVQSQAPGQLPGTQAPHAAPALVECALQGLLADEPEGRLWLLHSLKHIHTLTDIHIVSHSCTCTYSQQLAIVDTHSH